MTLPKEIVRVAALGDLHYPKIPQEMLQGLLTQATEQSDVLLLCGALPASQLDITNAILQSVGQTPWSNPNLHRRYSMLTDL